MIRIGVDFGGTKIEAAAIAPDGEFVARVRRPNPGGYDAALETVAGLVVEVEAQTGPVARLGVGMPGAVSPRTGLIRGANSVWLNGRPFRDDLERRLARPVRVANDADCFALSEASDGAAAGAASVFGAILGTGCGGGVVVNGRLLQGANGIAGEWGHTPLPWPGPDELPPTRCWCGRSGCLETYISGTGFERDYARTGPEASGREIVEAVRAGEPRAVETLDRYVDRLGRGLAVICNLLDPQVIVLGGGMSNVDELYARVPAAIARHVFCDNWDGRVVRALHGDSSGVRGAAWLWPLEP
ncbi:MAG: ROK family protein [Proteobacteria bacterium]|nr:ROK family protein [Pseudomonadota bacterium]MBW3617338.1 ROK family protein [Pseudomonadota bacterium]